MSKITDEANRIVKMTNDSRYMGYSFVSEAQQQAANVLKVNKNIQVLAKQVENFVSLFQDDFNYDDGVWFLDANIDEFLELAEELANKHLEVK